ncbi:glycoside hydrolase family 16 protein [Actinomadura rubrisoli]|uniref:Glycosyl hydrolase family protein n=1 Tax=Actinomadura rubrisoli TaxID=2530368 RepID=A0A4R5ANU7_9ACTN|nr:glycoside hydrolase family 16 protein [Actinomadura rubrisoli]TDD73319.1 glycosyl hydrolase family protein [Actinomadura rubrisoli]
MHLPTRKRMAVLTGGILAAGISAGAAAQGGSADTGRPTGPAGALERSAPAVVGGGPAPAAHADGTDARKGGGRMGRKAVPPTAARRYKWGRPEAFDEFGGTRLDRRNWEAYDGPGNGGLGRRSSKAVTVRKGALKITGTKDGTTGGVAWMPGGREKGGRKYGRWEARVKLNRACACYNANLLLWPVGGGGDTDPKGGGGEIDWMETYNDRGLRKATDFFLHYDGPKGEPLHLSDRVYVDLTKWHAFAMEWTPKGITGYVDGRRWFRTTERRALPPGKMGQAIQLDWFPKRTKLTVGGVSRVAPATLEVDWIRLYRLKKKH